MEIIIVKGQELFELMQHVNLLKVKFGTNDVWAVAPVLYATEESADILLDMQRMTVPFSLGEKVILKFQKSNNEFLISGEVSEIGTGNPAAVTVRIIMAQKYCNLRKYMRFDADLKVVIHTKGKKQVESVARNISKGGAMILAKADLDAGDCVDIRITFDSGNCFQSTAKIMRKSSLGQNGYSYGIQFLDVSEDNSKIIHMEISKYEREFLKSLNILKEYKNKSESAIDTKIAIISYEADESYEIRETLVKLGAEDFQVYHNFKFYTGFFAEEQPKIIIMDALEYNSDIQEIVENITSEFPGMYLILLVPMEVSGQSGDLGIGNEKVSVLFKPLIYDEFEKEIIKFL